MSLVRPHTEYATPAWDPPLLSDINSLENVQKFALHVCCKQWDTAYSELLSWSNVPSLENRRLYLKLCHLSICYFPPGIVVPNTSLSHSSRSILIVTTAFLSYHIILSLLCTRLCPHLEVSFRGSSDGTIFELF